MSPTFAQLAARAAPAGADHADRLGAIRLIVIGASAGGVEALGLLLRALPAHCPAAVAVVLHLPTGRSSMLPQLYADRCALPIKEVEDKEPARAGTVYFASPDYHLQLEPDHTFSLSQDAPVHFSRPSIDVAFESAAYAYGAALLAIVLSGASADGAAGLALVRRRGGLAWVQDPASAQVPVMPAAAIARAGADRIGTLAEIGAALAALGPPRQGP
ncbi:MAG: chemotaxis protein CheB [Pseudomonadota bacterium]